MYKEYIPIHNTEDKSWWHIHGNNLENQFIKILNQYKIKAQINPEKKHNPYAPDLIVAGKLADLKTQNAPFFTSTRYGYNPKYTVTFNRKDYERYERLYPKIHVYFWVDWQILEWKNEKVDYLNNIFGIKFDELCYLIKQSPEHFYKKRINDNKGNAKSSFLLDVRKMKSLKKI